MIACFFSLHVCSMHVLQRQKLINAEKRDVRIGRLNHCIITSHQKITFYGVILCNYQNVYSVVNVTYYCDCMFAFLPQLPCMKITSIWQHITFASSTVSLASLNLPNYLRTHFLNGDILMNVSLHL